MNAHEQIRLFCHAKFAAYAIFYRGVACRSLFAALFLGGLAAIGSADWFSQALRLSSLFYPTFGLASMPDSVSLCAGKNSGFIRMLLAAWLNSMWFLLSSRCCLQFRFFIFQDCYEVLFGS